MFCIFHYTNKGRIYVLRTDHLRRGCPSNVWDDGKIVGTLNGEGFLCWEREPGTAVISSKIENTSTLNVNVQAGKCRKIPDFSSFISRRVIGCCLSYLRSETGGPIPSPLLSENPTTTLELLVQYSVDTAENSFVLEIRSSPVFKLVVGLESTAAATGGIHPNPISRPGRPACRGRGFE
jgi:hypothetical protein